MTELQTMSPVELVLRLFQDSGRAAQYKREIEKRIGKRSYEASVKDMEKLINPPSATMPDVGQIESCKPTMQFEPVELFIGDGVFRPLPREDFSKVGAWRIAEAILNTDWEGCYTKTQAPHDSLVTLRRIMDKKLVTVDDFDSPGHANLFRVIIGEFNKWASKRLSEGESGHA